jgi:hypothetical protein
VKGSNVICGFCVLLFLSSNEFYGVCVFHTHLGFPKNLFLKTRAYSADIALTTLFLSTEYIFRSLFVNETIFDGRHRLQIGNFVALNSDKRRTIHNDDDDDSLSFKCKQSSFC